MTGESSTRPEVAAALLILERMGLSVDDLAGGQSSALLNVPTFSEFVPKLRLMVKPGTLKAYGTYWNRLVARWPDRRIDEPTHMELGAFAEELRTNRTRRRNGRNGDGTVENFVGAVRFLYRQAVAEQYISREKDPSQKIEKPRRPSSLRKPLVSERFAQLAETAAATGDDPELDSLIIRLHAETACRRAGALALRPVDLDEEQCLVLLREKDGSDRWQPVSPTLMGYLLDHATSRHAAPHEQLLRYRNGRPITYRRYDHLWERLGRHLAWVARQNVSTHWIRRTILHWVERTFGYAIARRYAGHEDNQARGASHDVGTTIIYVAATLAEVASALSVLTGEMHPLADLQLVSRHGESAA